jgi:hypothetical protein
MATRVDLSVGVWYDKDLNVIKMEIPGHGLTSVSHDPESKRGNPNLYDKLALALRDAGVEHPPGI